MCGFYCIAFIENMLAGKTLLDYITLFSPNDYKQNDQIKYKYFMDKMSSLDLDEKTRSKKKLSLRIYNKDLMSEKNKRHVACKYVNYVEHLF